MLTLTQAAVVVVGAETQAALDGLDSAYVAHLRMSAEAVDGLRQSGLPISQSRRLIGQLFDAQATAIAWRKQTEAAISTLQVIHKRSNQAEVDIGCAAPWSTEFFTTGEGANIPADNARETEIAHAAE